MQIIKIPTDLASMGHADKSAPESILPKKGITIPCNPHNLAETNESIQSYFKEHKEPFLAIGGDHSITYHIIKGLDTKVDFIVFDAHPDLMDNFVPPTHEDYLRVLIEENLIDTKLLLGFRKYDPIETSYIKEKNISYISSEELMKTETDACITTSIQTMQNPIYLSIDIDIIDPSVAPGTGYPEPNGISKERFFELLKVILRTKKVTYIDLVEVNTKQDKNKKTLMLAQEIIDYILQMNK